MDFRWNEWNREHVTKHGVTIEEAEAIVCGAVRPFPLRREDDRWLVWGRGSGGRLLQVVYLLDEDDVVFVIHARPLDKKEKRAYRARVQR